MHSKKKKKGKNPTKTPHLKIHTGLIRHFLHTTFYWLNHSTISNTLKLSFNLGCDSRQLFSLKNKNYAVLSTLTEFVFMFFSCYVKQMSICGCRNKSQRSTKTIPNLASFHVAIFTAVSTRPCTEVKVMAGCRKLLCQKLNNIPVMERTSFWPSSQILMILRNSIFFFFLKSIYLHQCISVTCCVQEAI